MLTESRFLEILTGLLGPPPPGVQVGVGDDAAVFAGDPGTVVAADMILDGVDFVLAECGYRAAAIKAVRKNVSDLAAMGARPSATFVSVALPASIGEAEARELLVGLTGEADRWGCPIAGGDTKRSSGSLVLAVTMIGRMEGREPVLRGGAKPGDILFVTGPLGGSSRGRHLTPPVRIDFGVRLAERGDVHAMVDLSDGLSRDLSRICEASAVDAVVLAERVPIHKDAMDLVAAELAAEGPDQGVGGVEVERAQLQHALHDGEDFELLFALPEHAARSLAEDPQLRGHCHRVGRIVARGAGEARLMLSRDGACEPLEVCGFQHVFGDPSDGDPSDRGARRA